MLALALVPARLGIPPPPPRPHCTVAARMGAVLHAPWERVQSACIAEVGLRAGGWGDPWISGALQNAWSESRWNPRAVDPSGQTVGFWQLSSAGLGKGMGDLRFDVSAATSAVIGSARRQRMKTGGRDPEEGARQFCFQIMRPADKVRRCELRARDVRRFSADDPDE